MKNKAVSFCPLHKRKSIRKAKQSSIVLIIALLSFLASINSASAQQVLDKIVAVVGNEMIMQSDVIGQIAFLVQQDPKINPDDKEIFDAVLNDMINQKLIVAKAFEDSIEVSDEEITQRWEYHIANLAKHYGSTKRIEDVYGMSLSRLQAEYYDDLKKQIMVEKIRQQEFGNLKASPKEVEDYYKEFISELPEVPEKIEIYHLVKNVGTGEDIKKSAYELGMRIKDSILNGGDFADFAKRYSKDPGTAAYGGDLGWIEKGKFIKEFEQAAFTLQIGKISDPVETPFGYHIIRTVNKNKDSLHSQHILLKFGPSDADIDTVKSILNALKREFEKTGDFEALAKQHSDEKETKGFGGLIGKLPLAYIPKNFLDALNSISDGEITEPVAYNSEPKLSYHIIYKKRTIPAHKADLKEDYLDLEQFATLNKQEKMFLQWIEKLRADIYWEIKD